MTMSGSIGGGDSLARRGLIQRSRNVEKKLNEDKKKIIDYFLLENDFHTPLLTI